MYEVIHFFTDLQDFSHTYNVGDVFPREGFNPSEERCMELCGNKNRQGKRLIKRIKNGFFKYTEFDLQEMPSKEIKQLAAENGYDLPSSPPAPKEEIIFAFMEQQEAKQR